MKYLFWVIAPSLLIFGAFALRQNSTSEEISIPEIDVVPSRQQLRRSFFQKKEILVVYSATADSLASRYENLLESLSQTSGNGFMGEIAIKYKEVSAVNEQDLSEQILFLVGSPKSHPVLRRLTKDNPIKFGSETIAFEKKKISSEQAVLMVSFVPNPENRLLPMGYLTAADEEQLYAFFESKIKSEGRRIFRQNLDFNIYKNKTRVVLGNYDKQWNLDSTTLFDFTENNNTVFRSEYFDFISHQTSASYEEVQAIAKGADQAVARMLKFFDHKGKLPRIAYHIYGTAEDKGLITSNTNQAHFEEEELAVHTVINEKYKNNFIEKENALLISQLMGSAKTSVLELGLPVYFTKQWQRKGYRYWTGRLFNSGNALTLEELFDDEVVAIESPLVIDCMSASLVAFLLETWGKTNFLKKYSGWVPEREEIKRMEPLWQQYLSSVTSTISSGKRPAMDLPYLKGFNFAHEGYSIYNGYASAKATEAIEKQKKLGSNALALIPYSYIRDVNEPAAFYFSNSAGNENDQGIVHSAFEAKRLGMFTLLKPQIFVGNSWPGNIEMRSETDWELFFTYYYRWIRHYALLAEIHKIDALCIGVEFTKATLGQADRWREMIKRTRGLFSGKITYAANWGAEFENIEFWDELDFIGLNCYYPLSKKDNPTDEELRAKFDTVKTKIRKVHSRFKKPIVLTEIGFRSINTPWKNPHAEGDDSFNEEHQRRCYEIVFKGIENENWCHGILWWKFPSYLEYRGLENSAFTPNNKQAEATVKDWFSR